MTWPRFIFICAVLLPIPLGFKANTMYGVAESGHMLLALKYLFTPLLAASLFLTWFVWRIPQKKPLGDVIGGGIILAVFTTFVWGNSLVLFANAATASGPEIVVAGKIMKISRGGARGGPPLVTVWDDNSGREIAYEVSGEESRTLTVGGEVSRKFRLGGLGILYYLK